MLTSHIFSANYLLKYGLRVETDCSLLKGVNMYANMENKYLIIV